MKTSQDWEADSDAEKAAIQAVITYYTNQQALIAANLSSEVTRLEGAIVSFCG